MRLVNRFVTFLHLALAAAASAAVTPAPLFTDHAVLQRDKPVPVWGQADAGEKVMVTFGEQKRSTAAGKDGRWIVFLDPLRASAQGADLTIAGKNTIVARDVVVGEVWLCSGQSNMEWPVARAANAPQEIAAANTPLLRHIKIEKTIGDGPRDTVKAGP
jgi:sialate O-acetylesterase